MYLKEKHITEAGALNGIPESGENSTSVKKVVMVLPDRFYKAVFKCIIAGVILEQVFDALKMLRVFYALAVIFVMGVLCSGVYYWLKNGGKDEDQDSE